MTKKVRDLITGEIIIDYGEDGESRIRQVIEERGQESNEYMNRFIEEYMYLTIYSDHDCTGEWFTRRHSFCRVGQYWVIRFYEFVDL